MELKNLDSNKTFLQNVKQRFFAMRNGMLADRLRNAGSPFPIIFGLNLPQLKEIAEVFGKNSEYAQTLWHNSTTRESRLMAPMLMDPNEYDMESALRWVDELTGIPEEADVLCHSLLRHLSYKGSLISLLKDSESSIKRYVALRLLLSDVRNFLDVASQAATDELERNDALTLGVAVQLKDEIEFVTGRSG